MILWCGPFRLIRCLVDKITPESVAKKLQNSRGRGNLSCSLRANRGLCQFSKLPSVLHGRHARYANGS